MFEKLQKYLTLSTYYFFIQVYYVGQVFYSPVQAYSYETRNLSNQLDYYYYYLVSEELIGINFFTSQIQGNWHSQSSSGKMFYNGFGFNENIWHYDWRNTFNGWKYIWGSNLLKEYSQTKNIDTKEFMHIHCIVHQEALCSKLLGFENVMKVVNFNDMSITDNLNNFSRILKVNVVICFTLK